MVQESVMTFDCGCDDPKLSRQLLSVDAALAKITATVRPSGQVERLPLGAALGRTLAHPVRAAAAAPPFDNSAMDGFALRHSDLSSHGSSVLKVVATVFAGQSTPVRIGVGEAALIFTGAPIPLGADTVVMQENTRCDGDRLVLKSLPRKGAHIRRMGEDMTRNKIIVPNGRCLRASDIAAAAGAGAREVIVYTKVRVGLLTTGDEVSATGKPLVHGAIWDVNTPMLVAQIGGLSDVEIVSVSCSGDSREGLGQKFLDLSQTADIIATTGGISAGAADYVKSAFTDIGGQIAFSGVAMKPGKPVSFGQIGQAFWMGLPGNPISAFVTWQLFGHGLLGALRGVDPKSARRTVAVQSAVTHKPGRREYRLARLVGFDGAGHETVACPETTHSARVSHLAEADGLIVIPREANRISAGDLLEYHPFHSARGCPL